MTTRTITALFDTYDAAANAVRKLEAAGVAHSDISIVSNDAGHSRYYDKTGDQVSGTGTGASLGTLLGGGAGLLAGLGMLAIPGLGPVVAAGWLASTLVGAGVGAAAGGLVGSLTDAGVTHEDAHVYAEGIRRGGTLVTVRADDSLTSRVTDILDDEGTVDINERESTWRAEGWSGQYVGSSAAGSTAPASGSGYAGTSTGVSGAVSRAAETVKDDARRLGDKLTSSDTRPVGTSSSVSGTVPVTDYGTTPRTGEDDRRLGRGRVRIYPEAL